MPYDPNDQERMSDEALNNERIAQTIVSSAVIDFLKAIHQASRLTTVMRSELDDLLGVVQDSTPNQQDWDDQIHEARRKG